MTDPVPGLSFDERALYMNGSDVLVVADLHVGRAESSAVSLPLGERADLVDRLSRLADRFDPETVVVAGDVVHTFDRVSDRSVATLDALREVCAAAGATLDLVAGNHDTALSTAWDGPIHEEYVLAPPEEGDATPRTTVVCHGHEPPSTAADRYVIGHVHPAIEIEGDRRPCFLYGEELHRDADVFLLPAFTRLASGVAVNGVRGEGLDTPLVADADRLSPVVFDSETGESLAFPELGVFRRLL